MFDYKVKIFKLNNSKGSLLAFADVEIDGLMVVKGFKLMNSQYGMWVSPPSHKGKNKEGGESWFHDVTFLGDVDEKTKRTPFQEEMYNEIISAYEQLANSSPQANQSDAANVRNDPPRSKGNSDRQGRRSTPW